MSRQKPVGIGIAGLGFMGLTHLRASRRLRGGKLVAIATSDPKKARGDFSGVGGNFGERGGQEDLSGVEVHADLESMLADDRVDLVDICLPSYLHPSATIESLKAGKAVICEKPIAVREADAKKMIDAARRAGRPLMIAQVLKFFPEFELLLDATRDERWGALRALHMSRRIAFPSWGDASWFSDPKLSGGMVIDLHIHDTDFIVQLLGKPRAVESSGIVDDRGVSFVRTSYRYGKSAPLVTSDGGWINAPGLPFEQGYDAYFENATLHYDSTNCPAPKLYTSAGRKPKEFRFKNVDAFRGELQAAVDTVRSGEMHPLLDAKSAALSLAVCRAEERSVRTRKKVEVRL